MYLREVSDPATSEKHAQTILPSPEHTIQTHCVTEGSKILIASELKPIKLFQQQPCTEYVRLSRENSVALLTTQKLQSYH